MKKQVQIDIGKKYDFPNTIEVVKHKDVWLAIAVETACWIVLNNESQLAFFNLLRRKTIASSLEEFSGILQDAQWVLVQLEARQFCSNECHPYKETNCMVYLTNECNMRCPHCFLSAGTSKQNELSTEEIKNFLRNIKSNGINSVTFSGGEIALRPDLIDIIKFASLLDLSVNLLTNGVLWKDDMIKAVAPLIKSIQISIDGYCEEDNARVRGRGNFQKALKAVDGFMRHGVLTQIAITPMPDSALVSKMGAYAEFAKSLKAKYNNSPKLKILFTSGFMDGRSISLTSEQRESYRNTMNKVMNMYLNEDARDYPFILDHQSRRIMTNCSYGSLNIASDGDVYICSRTGLMPIANLRTDSMDEIMRKAKMAAELSEINNLQPCSKCHLKYICGGGCRVEEFPSMKTGPYTLKERPRRFCDKSIKEEFYDLMIRTNKHIFQ